MLNDTTSLSQRLTDDDVTKMNIDIVFRPWDARSDGNHQADADLK